MFRVLHRLFEEGSITRVAAYDAVEGDHGRGRELACYHQEITMDKLHGRQTPAFDGFVGRSRKIRGRGVHDNGPVHPEVEEFKAQNAKPTANVEHGPLPQAG